MNELIEWSQGNPGALDFLMKVFMSPEADVVQAIKINNKIKRCKSLRGTNIYVLYSDLCDRDIDKVVQLCKNCPDDILEDACNRQDYSGRELVSSYFDEPVSK